MRIAKLFGEFFESEKISGFMLIACTVFSLLLTNSGIGDNYNSLWNASFAGHTLTDWINDGLMTIFFLLAGLEIKREIYSGGLKTIRHALLPVMAAVGGMIVPALVHVVWNLGTTSQRGFGIPMATDIAFSLGILSLAGKRIPTAVKIFLTAFAIIDDLGAILIIAFFYSNGLSWINLCIALGIFAGLLIMARLKVKGLLFYIVPGAAMWYFMLQSGVHPTISGVLLAFSIHFGSGGDNTPSSKLQHFLHKPVAFIIMPLFALANTCIILDRQSILHLSDRNSLGIMLGLFIGKPLGIFAMAWFTLKTRLGSLQEGLSLRHVLGAGILGGIGFTMSIFIALLAFPGSALIATSKIAIVAASFLSGITGLVYLRAIKPIHPYSLPDE